MINNKNDMIKRHVISIVAIILSVAAICLSICRIKPITADWMAVLVGILSMLVLFLVVWQVYSFVDFRTSIKEMKLSNKEFNYQIVNSRATSGMAIMDCYYRLITNDRQGVWYQYILHGVLSIIQASFIKDIETCNALVAAMIQVIASPEKIKLTKEQKGRIFSFIYQVKYGCEIERYTDLLKKLMAIEEI